jgi:hypothetical protein
VVSWLAAFAARHHAYRTADLVQEALSIRRRWAFRRVWQSARRKLLQRREITPNERLLLRPAPLLELAFALDGVRDAVEPLRKHQRYRPSALGVPAKCSGVVLCNSYFQRRSRRPDVEASVGTSKDVEKGSFHHFLPAFSALIPHPEERRQPRLEGCWPVCGLMVRDGASRLLTMRVNGYPFGRLS